MLSTTKKPCTISKKIGKWNEITIIGKKFKTEKCLKCAVFSKTIKSLNLFFKYSSFAVSADHAADY